MMLYDREERLACFPYSLYLKNIYAREASLADQQSHVI